MTKNRLKKRLVIGLLLMFLFQPEVDGFSQDHTLEDSHIEADSSLSPDSRDKPTGAIQKQKEKIDRLKKRLKALNAENIDVLKERLKFLSAENINIEEENRFLRNSLRIAQEIQEDSKKARDDKTKAAEEKLEKIKRAFQEQERLITEKRTGEFQNKQKILRSQNVKLIDANKSLEKEIENLKETLAVDAHKLGEIYTQKKLYKEAMNAYKKALRYNPNNYQSSFHLGLLCAYEGQSPEEALVYLREFLKLSPEKENKKKAAKLIELLE